MRRQADSPRTAYGMWAILAASAIVGMILGLHCQLILLISVIGLSALVALISAAAGHEGLWLGSLSSILSIVSLQIGYLAGSSIMLSHRASNPRILRDRPLSGA